METTGPHATGTPIDPAETAAPAARRVQPASDAPEPERSAPAVDDTVPLPVVLDRLRVFAQKRDRGLFISLDDASLLERRDGYVKLAIPNDFHHKRLSSRIREVEQMCSEFFGAEIRADLVADAPTRGSAPGQAARGDASRAAVAQSAGDGAISQREEERRRRRDALNHPGINIALEVLEADIVEIRPLGGKQG
jgi:hypothetical protein